MKSTIFYIYQCLTCNNTDIPILYSTFLIHISSNRINPINVSIGRDNKCPGDIDSGV